MANRVLYSGQMPDDRSPVKRDTTPLSIKEVVSKIQHGSAGFAGTSRIKELVATSGHEPNREETQSRLEVESALAMRGAA